MRTAHDSLEAQVEARTAELRDANAQLAVVASETVHRSRNLLSVVASLAQQTARGRAQTSEFLDALLGRIKPLANATSAILRGEDSASQSLATIVHNQLEPMMLTYGQRISVSGPEIAVGPEAAQQISLALHELATNAQKYNLLSDDAARVDIGWSLAGTEADGQMLTLEWREVVATGTAEAAAWGEGFGTKLLLRIVPATLKGTAERISEGGALRYRLTVPVAELVGDIRRRGKTEHAARIVDRSFGKEAD